MKNAYKTKRLAPQGYVAVNKNLAEILYNEHIPVTIAGNNVNSFHIFNGWTLGCTMVKNFIVQYGEENTFSRLVKGFMQYTERELGTYPVFYVETEIYQAWKDTAVNKESAS